MVEYSPPRIIFDDEADATPDQREAMDRFDGIARQFTEDGMREALAKIESERKRIELERKQGNLKPAEPNDGSQLSALAAVWGKVLDTGAITQVRFDDATEQIIEKSPRYLNILSQYGTKRFLGENFNPDEIRSQVVRERFAIYAGRLAAMYAEVKEEDTGNLGQAS